MYCFSQTLRSVPPTSVARCVNQKSIAAHARNSSTRALLFGLRNMPMSLFAPRMMLVPPCFSRRLYVRHNVHLHAAMAAAAKPLS